MKTTFLRPAPLAGFKVVPRRLLGRCFSPSQSAFFVLLGRRGGNSAPRERVLFVHYLDRFLDTCQLKIEKLWQTRRVLITHVAVKVGRLESEPRRDFSAAYARAVAVQRLREKLQPRFRRL